MIRDPGLQPERTNLAWQRTICSTLACSVLLLRVAITEGNVMLILLGGLHIASAAALSGVLHARFKSLPDQPSHQIPHADLMLWVACTTALAVSGALLVIVQDISLP
ncbi:DUF202 domain-containing protein [Cupriavidus sp. CP313]